MGASAEREIEFEPNKVFDLSDRDNRIDIVRMSPQINSLSKRKGNKEFLCAASCIAAAVIMTSKDAGKAKANAKALEWFEGCGANWTKKIKTPKNVMAGLRKMELKARDVWELQQYIDRVFPYIGMRSGGYNVGASADQVASLVGLLYCAGGLQDDAIFTNNHTKFGSDEGLHWTAMVENVSINPYPSSKGGPFLLLSGGRSTGICPTRQSNPKKWEATVKRQVGDPLLRIEFKSSRAADKRTYSEFAQDVEKSKKKKGMDRVRLLYSFNPEYKQNQQTVEDKEY